MTNKNPTVPDSIGNTAGDESGRELRATGVLAGLGAKK